MKYGHFPYFEPVDILFMFIQSSREFEIVYLDAIDNWKRSKIYAYGKICHSEKSLNILAAVAHREGFIKYPESDEINSSHFGKLHNMNRV